ASTGGPTEPESAGNRDRIPGPPKLHRHPRNRGGPNDWSRRHRRLRRFHSGTTHHPNRAGRIRESGRAPAARARRTAHRLPRTRYPPQPPRCPHTSTESNHLMTTLKKSLTLLSAAALVILTACGGQASSNPADGPPDSG